MSAFGGCPPTLVQPLGRMPRKRSEMKKFGTSTAHFRDAVPTSHNDSTFELGSDWIWGVGTCECKVTMGIRAKSGANTSVDSSSQQRAVAPTVAPMVTFAHAPTCPMLSNPFMSYAPLAHRPTPIRHGRLHRLHPRQEQCDRTGDAQSGTFHHPLTSRQRGESQFIDTPSQRGLVLRPGQALSEKNKKGHSR